MTDPAAAQAGTDPAAGQGTTTATPPAAPAQPQPPASQPALTVEAFAKLQADLEAANQRAAQMQTEARKHEDRWKQRDTQLDEQQKTLKLLADKLGVQVDDKPDPAKLAAQAETERNGRLAAMSELALFRAALDAGANASALLDSRSFMAKAGALDPTSATYGEQVKALVAEQVAANPSLAMQQPATQPADGQPAAPQPTVTPLPAASGPVATAAPETGRQWTEADLAAASPEETSRAIEQGLLVNLGIGKTRRTRIR
jgi:hypothetical protein